MKNFIISLKIKKSKTLWDDYSKNNTYKKKEEDLLISYGDIIYEKKNLEKLVNTDAEVSIMVDLNWKNLWLKRFEDRKELKKFERFSHSDKISKKEYNQLRRSLLQQDRKHVKKKR